MPKHHHSSSKIKGFTLIEVMVVVALIGIIVTLVQFNFSGKRPSDILKKESFKFVGLFEGAADYGLLNNIELGLIVEDQSYQFVGYDGVKWHEIPEQDWLSLQKLPDNVVITLKLDELPIEEPLLFDSKVFEKDDDELSFKSTVLTTQEEKEKQKYPQVYILSGGDITPFSLTFHFDEETILIDDLESLAYRVTGIYSTPLSIEGPTLDDK